MRAARIAAFFLLGIIGILTPLLADDISYKITVFFLDDSDNIVAWSESDCYGNINSDGDQSTATHMSAMQQVCRPQPICDPDMGYHWWILDTSPSNLEVCAPDTFCYTLNDGPLATFKGHAICHS